MTVYTGSTLRRISLGGLDSSTPGGGFGNSPYLNSLQMAVGTQAVPANPLYILQPCARGIASRTSPPKTRQIHRVHRIVDRENVAVSFSNLRLNQQTGHCKS